ncbi:hypothetical protein BHM03_00056264 [Ensete ventricosum]|nr:hypothetical protein BHM03_00056264 [Ensete ventricosum]
MFPNCDIRAKQTQRGNKAVGHGHVVCTSDALVLLHPHCAIAPVQATAALPRGDRPYWRQGWLRVATHCGLTAGDRPYGLAAVGCARGLAAAPMGGHTLQVAKPWPAARAGGLAVASHLCMQTACMWPPLPRRQCLL